MQAYVDAGLTSFDMADIYGPAEEIFGQFNSQVETYSHTHTVLCWLRLTLSKTQEGADAL